MKLMKSLVLSVLCAVCCGAPASALTVSPMQVEMVSVGKGSHAQVSVVNNSGQPLPVEAVIRRMTLDESGASKTSQAGEDFLIMPPQALIPPGATQNFRVQWLGDPMLAQSQSYYLFMNQIPVKLPQGKNGVQVVMSMGVMINVAPAQGAPAMKVVATSVTTDKSGKKVPVITVENTSNFHALLPNATINLSSGNWSSTLSPRALGDGIGIGLVQPGQRRRFTLPVELPPGVANVQASLSLPSK
jgi:fimbrial chaperone protein